MEIQIPLVLFTSFLSWSVGIFGTQCILALKKRGSEIQMVSLVVSLVVLVIGGIAVLFHLTHPFSIFNGFGNLTSGITQELIAIAVLVVVAVVYFLMLRRSDDKTVSAWLAIIGLVVCLVLVVAMGHSYMLDSRPTWNSIFQLLSLLGAACVLGPATVAIIAAVKKTQIEGIGLFTVIGSIVNAVLTGAFLFSMQATSSTLQSFDYYFDPTHPNYALVSSSDVSLFSGDCLAATVVIILGAVLAIVAAIIGKKKQDAWSTWGTVVLIAGLACVIALRVSMYIMGETLFLLY